MIDEEQKKLYYNGCLEIGEYTISGNSDTTKKLFWIYKEDGESMTLDEDGIIDLIRVLDKFWKKKF